MLISTITKSQPIDILTERLFIDIFIVQFLLDKIHPSNLVDNFSHQL